MWELFLAGYSDYAKDRTIDKFISSAAVLYNTQIFRHTATIKLNFKITN